MNIRNRLYITALISIMLVVILVSVTFITSNKIARKSKEHELANDMYLAVAELNIITYEYLMHHEERMEQQWNLKYHTTARDMGEELATPIRADYAVLADLFSQVTINYKKRQRLIQEGTSQEKIDAALLLEERLVDQLLIKSQKIINDASRLAENAHTEVVEAQELARNLTLILMIILAIIVTTTSLVVARSISEPLDKLTKGAEIIGKGNLEHRIDIKTKDEIGELANAFNQMTGDLKESRKEVKKYTKELEKKSNKGLNNCN